MSTLKVSALQHPSSPSANITLNADGTVANAAGMGKILQVVSTVKTDTWTASIAANSFADITGLSATITPTSASSTILVDVRIGIGYNPDGAGTNLYGIAIHDGTDYISVGDAAGSRTRLGYQSVAYQTSGLMAPGGLGLLGKVTSGSTSARTYQVKFCNTRGATNTGYINRTGDSNSAAYARTVSSITVMEVAA